MVKMIAQPPELQPYSLICTPKNESEHLRTRMILLVMVFMLLFIMGAIFFSYYAAITIASHIERGVKISVSVLEECI
uniref:Uncharacterized protein n=1 Tax=Microplitis mediator bracovirus TaxID=1836595 RepID=A0A1D5APK8_9VIRU|nr:hypothetical protein A6F54_88 [Microplitis mediator bracovirus]